jgi:hypothetical protein
MSHNPKRLHEYVMTKNGVTSGRASAPTEDIMPVSTETPPRNPRYRDMTRTHEGRDRATRRRRIERARAVIEAAGGTVVFPDAEDAG